MSQELQLRSEIDEQYKWRLEDIFPDDSAWEGEFRRVQKEIPKLKKNQGHIHESAEILLAALREAHTLEEAIGKLYSYAHMRNDEDKSIGKYQEQYDRMGSLIVEYNQTMSWFEPELLSMSEEEIGKMTESEPDLDLYRHYMDNLMRTKPYILSEKEERIMALSGEVRGSAADIFSNWDNADIEYPKIKDAEGKEIRLTEPLYNKFQESPDRELRKRSYHALYVPYIGHRNMLSASYSAIVKSHIFNARARGYKSTLQAALDRNNVPEKVYHTLIDTARFNVKPLRRYVALRKKLLNLKQVRDYDLRAPLFEKTQREYSWQDACQMVIDGAERLGEDYVETLRDAFNSRWIDVYENKGKRTGAYSSGTYGVHPYVLMNFNGTLNDIFTLTHEMGHALHTWYTIKNQPYVYGDYPIFLAEVASTTNEALLERHLIRNAASKEEKLGLLDSALKKYNSTFYRQAIFAEFELRSHEMAESGEALTADKLDELFGRIYRDYYGDEFELIRENKALWSRVPHFYYNYYVFQYSTSFVASQALVSRILEEGDPARERYLGFLKSGRSKYPLDTLREAGVDMSSADPVKRTIQLMDDLLDQVEKLV